MLSNRHENSGFAEVRNSGPSGYRTSHPFRLRVVRAPPMRARALKDMALSFLRSKSFKQALHVIADREKWSLLDSFDGGKRTVDAGYRRTFQYRTFQALHYRLFPSLQH
jgi:hypothetical protein